MTMFKTIVTTVVIIQFSMGLPISNSLSEVNLNTEDTHPTLKVHDADQHDLGKSDSITENHFDQTPEFQMKSQPRQLPGNFAKLQLSDPTNLVSYIEQMQREQLFALAMAQFQQYTQQLIKQSTKKFSNIFKDLEKLQHSSSSEMIVTLKANIENYLNQLNDYKLETSNFLVKSQDIPNQFQNILSQLQTFGMNSLEMQQILQNNNLIGFEMDLSDYANDLKSLYGDQIEKLFKEVSSSGYGMEKYINEMSHDIFGNFNSEHTINMISKILKF
ncbi:uncharacterized protein [Musca autumnalis]|uniref:uncharacterized protein n=1 Tax=Musca autumnalis TaxID=221902 RepID=UPI003CF99A3C